MDVTAYALDVICVIDELDKRILSNSQVCAKLSPTSLDITRTALLGPGSTSILTHDILEIGRYDDRYSSIEGVTTRNQNGQASLMATNARARIGQNCMVEFFDPALGSYSATPGPEVLQAMDVVVGSNRIRISHPGSGAFVEFCVWGYTLASKLVVVDVDGTITKSSVRGYVHTVFMHSYSYTHEGITELLQSLVYEYDLNIVYLTSRPIFHLSETKQLLFNIWSKPISQQIQFGKFSGKINDSSRIMSSSSRKSFSNASKRKYINTVGGAVFANPESLAKAAYRELISQDTISFKSQVLMSILDVFSAAAAKAYSGIASDSGRPSKIMPPLFLAFGNKDDDAIAYAHAGVSPSNIFIIDKSSKIKVWSSIFQHKAFNKQQMSLLQSHEQFKGYQRESNRLMERKGATEGNDSIRSINTDSSRSMISNATVSSAGTSASSNSSRQCGVEDLNSSFAVADLPATTDITSSSLGVGTVIAVEGKAVSEGFISLSQHSTTNSEPTENTTSSRRRVVGTVISSAESSSSVSLRHLPISATTDNIQLDSPSRLIPRADMSYRHQSPPAALSRASRPGGFDKDKNSITVAPDVDQHKSVVLAAVIDESSLSSSPSQAAPVVQYQHNAFSVPSVSISKASTRSVLTTFNTYSDPALPSYIETLLIEFNALRSESYLPTEALDSSKSI